MSAFRDLLAEAHAKGVRSLDFSVNLEAFVEDEQFNSWTALSQQADIYATGLGRTGEEALRRFVEKL